MATAAAQRGRQSEGNFIRCAVAEFVFEESDFRRLGLQASPGLLLPWPLPRAGVCRRSDPQCALFARYFSMSSPRWPPLFLRDRRQPRRWETGAVCPPVRALLTRYWTT